jgi:predicted permease
MQFFRRLRFLLQRQQRDQDLAEELRLHQEMKARELEKSGMPAQEAVRTARLGIGNPALIKEHSRRNWGFPPLESFFQDLRYAVRQLRKNRGFTAVAILTLTLGIGANTAIFSVVNAVLLRPLPYKEPSRLLILGGDTKEADYGIAYKHYQAWKSENHSFEDIAVAYRNSGWSRVTLTGGEPENVQGTYASANFFPIIGIAPVIGRVFTSDEEVRHERVVVLSHSLWKQRFGGSPGALGKRLQINGENFEVIGAMPPDFQFPASNVQFWAPITTNAYWHEQPLHDSIHGAGFYWRWTALGRLKPGVVLNVARADLDAISRQWEQDPELKLTGVNLFPLQVNVSSKARLALYLLLGAVSFVLLIACSNVANLMLARGTVRQREMAIRTALGAARSRLVRQLLTESMVLAAISGGLALLVSTWGTRALVSFGPRDLPRLEQTSVDGWVLGFTLGTSLLAAVFFGLLPAVRSSRSNPGEALKSGAQSGTSGTRRSYTSAILVGVEFALSMVLLTGSGLLIRSFLAVESVDPGFEPEHVLTMHIMLREKQPEIVYHQLLERVALLPQVHSVGGVTGLFEDADLTPWGLRSVEGHEPEPRERWKTPFRWTAVSGDYFSAMGVSLVKGRNFSSEDGPSSPPVAVIDESTARRYWPNEDPIGKHFKGFDARGYCKPPTGCRDEWVTVIGMVRDMRRHGLENEPVPHAYEWYTQTLDRHTPQDLVVRTTGDPSKLADTLRGAIRTVAPTAVISGVTTLKTEMREQLAPRLFQTWLLTLFAVIAVLLASVGIYGVMHYVVAQRTREIGVRLALGAQPKDVFCLVAGQGMLVAMAGLGVGLIAAFSLTRLLQSLLFRVKPTDPVTLLVVPLALCSVALLACYVPARKAMKVDPMIALRYE